MVKEVIKRNGDVVPFDESKIRSAVVRAMDEVGFKYKDMVAAVVYPITRSKEERLSVEEIQDMVEELLIENKMAKVARVYIRYRYDREKDRALKNDFDKRFEQIRSLIAGTNEEANKENSNKDTRIASVMRDYIAGFTCKEMAKGIIPADILEAHNEGIIHFHDMDYSPAMPIHNCELINLEDMLQNGTVINGTMIEKPHSFRTACTLTSQISALVSSSTYGGQTINLSHLAPFVDVSRKRIREDLEADVQQWGFSEREINDYVEKQVQKEISQGIQTLYYQWLTLNSTNGQAPFVTLFMYIDDLPEGQTRDDLVLLIEEVVKQRIKGVKNKKGAYVTTAFPKLIYVLDEDNIYEDSEYWWLTKLCAECTAKRLVPDYVSAKKMKELKEGNVVAPMGCRSLLSPWKDENGEYKLWGRFNQGVVTLNLPDIALSSGGNEKRFWEIFDGRLNLCYRALMVRHNALKGTKASIAPILWIDGALARLNEDDVIDPLLYGGYSTISLGYAGLYETVKYMTGHSNSDEIGAELGMKIMHKLADTVARWKAETNIGFALYGTPLERTTDKFAKALKRRFGEIKGITDKGYVTNSYHITPKEEIDAFSKLEKESKFQELSLGGALSYIETPNMENNIPAILEIMKHIYETNMYAEINTTTSYCHVCGCRDLKMEKDLKYHCPHCGNDDWNKMNIAVRVCGYISTNPYVEGRAKDIYDRVYHIDNKIYQEVD